MNLGEARTNVKRFLTEISTSNLWTNSELDSYINEAQMQFVLETECLRGREIINVIENTNLYDIPSDAIRLDKLYYNNNILQQTFYEKKDEEVTSSGTPSEWWVWYDNDRVFEVNPIPNSNAATTKYNFVDGSSVTTNYGIIVDVTGSLTYNFNGNNNYGCVVDIVGSNNYLFLPNGGAVGAWLSDSRNYGCITGIFSATNSFITYYPRYPQTLSTDSDNLEIDIPYQFGMLNYAKYLALSREGEQQELVKANFRLKEFKRSVEQYKMNKENFLSNIDDHIWLRR